MVIDHSGVPEMGTPLLTTRPQNSIMLYSRNPILDQRSILGFQAAEKTEKAKKLGGRSLFRWLKQQIAAQAIPIVIGLPFPIGLLPNIWEWQKSTFFQKSQTHKKIFFSKNPRSKQLKTIVSN